MERKHTYTQFVTIFCIISLDVRIDFLLILIKINMYYLVINLCIVKVRVGFEFILIFTFYEGFLLFNM